MIVNITNYANNAEEQGCSEDNQIKDDNRRQKKRKSLELLVELDDVDAKIE